MQDSELDDELLLMSEQILINVTPQETRVAVLENSVLQEINIERANNRSIVGNLYLGRVVRVLPGMQGAFIEIGIQRTAFLHMRNLVPRYGHHQQSATHLAKMPAITTLLQEGQKLLVQVIKDPIGTKGARLTGQISLPSRNLVLLPNVDYIGISQQVRDPHSSKALISVVDSFRQQFKTAHGFIIRTVAESASDAQLHIDMDYLLHTWNKIEPQRRENHVPLLLHTDLPLTLRVMRDLAWNNIEKIRVDSRETYDQLIQYVRKFIPAAEVKIFHYHAPTPIFALHSIENAIKDALLARVALKSGGYLVIEQTEAMTTIDVNTGSFVGQHNLEETAFETNLEAAYVVARELRIRKIGGIIIVDFIDMFEQNHCDQVVHILEKALSQDRAHAKINAMTAFGLVEIARKFISESLAHQLTEPCPACAGRGTQKTAATCCYEIFSEIRHQAHQFEAKKYLVVAAQPIINHMLEKEANSLAELQHFIGKIIDLQVDPTYHQEQYDVVLI